MGASPELHKVRINTEDTAANGTEQHQVVGVWVHILFFLSRVLLYSPDLSGTH